MNKNATRGRTAKTLSVSMTPDQLNDLNKRLETLSPIVNGPSHYFRLLMQLDEKKGLIKHALGIDGDSNSFLEGFAC